jgi:hypothetical protein
VKRMTDAVMLLILISIQAAGCTPWWTGWMMAGALAAHPAPDDETARARFDSAHTTHCAPSDIAIRDRRAGFDYTTWTATCRGRDYTCGVHGFHWAACAPVAGVETF